MPHSYHIFLFPFSFETSPKLDLANWKPTPFEPKKEVDAYNQHSYFYDFVETTMFKQETIFFNSYLYNLKENTTYSIDIEKYEQKHSYVLNLEKVKLNLYHSYKVGVLAFYLSNNEKDDPEDILRINDYGRRIYPQYAVSYENKNIYKSNLESIQSNFLPKKLKIEGGDTIIEENFEKFMEKNFVSSTISAFIGTSIRYLIDDRMFCCCFYGNNTIMNKLKTYDAQKGYAFLTDDFWYQYIFVDNGGATCQSKTMKPKLLGDATNDRWVDYGTLFGISRYSFVVLTNGFDLPAKHLQTMYSEMAILCLAQRACILNFSAKVTDISKDGITSKEVADLYKQYIEFRNRLYFREVTAQEQGIELYDLLQKQMRLGADVKALDEEIAELNQFISNQEQGDLTQTVALYTPIAFVLSFLSLIGIDKLNQVFDLKNNLFTPDFDKPISLFGTFIIYSIVILSSFLLARPLLQGAKKISNICCKQ